MWQRCSCEAIETLSPGDPMGPSGIKAKQKLQPLGILYHVEDRQVEGPELFSFLAPRGCKGNCLSHTSVCSLSSLQKASHCARFSFLIPVGLHSVLENLFHLCIPSSWAKPQRDTLTPQVKEGKPGSAAIRGRTGGERIISLPRVTEKLALPFPRK